jgi:hypothetical protein
MVRHQTDGFLPQAQEFAGLELDGFLGIPQKVAINKSAGYGVWWNQIGGA